MKKFIIIKKAMLDKIPILVDQKKRYKHFHKLNMEEVNVLRSSEDAEYLSGEFDRIFLKIQRLISYSTNRNINEKSKLEEDTNNLLRKFSNYIK
jgi:ABC-type Mn2+/Zn2+ transport system ATPase subunit